MPNLKSTFFAMMLPLVVAGCVSRQPVVRAKPVPPPAWLMQPAPDWKTPLSGIISLSP
ncbi:hypothetical protein C5469_22930, partial [Photorhabdus cinerea]|nr:hypothetical protein [Photorhabdus cinerea]